MAQFAVPVSDQATGAWTTTPLWSKVDEGSASEDDVEIASDDNTSPDNADLELTNTGLSSPQAGNHIIRARWHKDASGGHSVNAICELWQGIPDTGSLIATLSVTGISDVEATDTYTLNGTEVGNITDYNDFYFRVSRQGDTAGNPATRRSLLVDLVEFEFPDAAPQDFPLNAEPGSYALTGATMSPGIAIVVASGSYVLSGVVADLVHIVGLEPNVFYKRMAVKVGDGATCAADHRWNK